MKTKFALCAGVGSLILASTASAGYVGLVAEEFSVSGVNAFTGATYELDVVRIYAQLENAGDRLDAVYGSADNPLFISTSAEFYQNAFGGNTAGQINAGQWGFFPSMEYDTFLTIGLLSSTGDALSVQDMDFSNFTTEISTSNGTWYVTPDAAQGEADAEGRVLIGQFSFLAGTGGLDSMYGNINLQGKDADGETWQVVDQWIPAPGALALLGLAGIAGRRRRRN